MAISYGIKASKPGQDVKTVLDKYAQFSSKFATLKILTKGDTSITTDGSGNGSVTVAHGLNYAPAYYVFRKGTAQYTYLDASSYTNSFAPVTMVPSIWLPETSTNGLSTFKAYTNDTNLVITATGASASTTYNFRYYLFVDLGQDYSGTDGVTLNSNYGMKVSKDGIDVKTGKEYEMGYSSKYKSLQYYDESYKTQDLTLPDMWATMVDTDVTEGTYVDFNHGLGYQPFYLVWAENIPYPGITSGANTFVPWSIWLGAGSQGGYIQTDTFCDSTKARVSFVRRSITTGTGNGPEFSSSTITIKCIIFTENLTT